MYCGIRFKQNRLLLGIILVVGILLASCKQDVGEGQRWQASITRTVVADYRQLARLAQKQRSQAESFCAAPSAAGLQKLQNRWRDTMSVWQRLQWVRFGPAIQTDLHDRLQFWPERDSAVLREVQAVLQRPGTITQQGLEQASVALQGLSTQELLLFDSEFAQLERFRGSQCELLRASTRLTAKNAKRLSQAWQDKQWLDQWFHAAPHPDTRVAQVRNRQLLVALLAQVEMLRDDKLGAPMGLTIQEADGNRAESWRSRHSLVNLQQNLKALQHAVSPDRGYGLFLFLKDQQQEALAEELVIAVDNLHLALQQVQGPLRDAVADPEQRAALQVAYDSADTLAQLLRHQVAPALNISLADDSAGSP